MASYCRALNMAVLAWSENLTVERAKAAGTTLVSKEVLLSSSDPVSIHLVLSSRSRGLSRPRELTHDASLYGAYLRAEERLREQGAEIHRVVLEQDLRREYQSFLQEHNRGRSDSDGRPDRAPHEVEEWRDRRKS
jgi:hypothetical protein